MSDSDEEDGTSEQSEFSEPVLFESESEDEKVKAHLGDSALDVSESEDDEVKAHLGDSGLVELGEADEEAKAPLGESALVVSNSEDEKDGAPLIESGSDIMSGTDDELDEPELDGTTRAPVDPAPAALPAKDETALREEESGGVSAWADDTAAMEPPPKLSRRWKMFKLEVKPDWGKQVVNARLSDALANGQMDFTSQELRALGVAMDELEDDFWNTLGSDGCWYEPIPDEGTMLCPLCRRVLLTVTVDGLVSSCFLGGRDGGSRNICPCRLATEPIDVSHRRAPLQQLRERLRAMSTTGARSVAATDAPNSTLGATAGSTSGSPSRPSLSVLTGFRRALQPPLPPSPGAAIASLRHSFTEALCRRFEVEQSNRELGDEQRVLQRQLRGRRKDSQEERKRAGAALVAAEKMQRKRVGQARQSVRERRVASRNALRQQLDALDVTLAQQRLSTIEQHRQRVHHTKSMQARSKQSVMGIKEANSVHAMARKTEHLKLEMQRDEARQALLERKSEQTRRLRAKSANFDETRRARAACMEHNAQTGAALRVDGSIARLKREGEQLDRMLSALGFREDLRVGQASSRALRASMEEERREQARREREKRERHEEECARASLQAMLKRKEVHDAVCQSRHAGELVAAEYREHQRSLQETERACADARAAAAKRAMAVRRQRRLQQERVKERGPPPRGSQLLRGLLPNSASTAAAPAEVRV